MNRCLLILSSLISILFEGCVCVGDTTSPSSSSRKEGTAYYGIHASCLRQAYHNEAQFTGLNLSLVNIFENAHHHRDNGFYGMEVAGFSHTYHFSGVFVGGVHLTEDLNGAQFGVATLTFFTKGIQCAALGNVSALQLKGLQVSPLYNIALAANENASTGGQLALVNVASALTGFQVGLLNISNASSTPLSEGKLLQIGILNKTNMGLWLPLSNFGL